MTEQQMVSTMEALLRVSRQAEADLRGCAAAIAAEGLRGAMLCRADEHAVAAGELRQRLGLGGDDGIGAARCDPSIAAAPAGAARPPPAASAAGLDEAVLAACDAAECRALQAWRLALDDPLPESLRPWLHDRLAAFVRRHRRTRVLLHVARHGNLALPPDEAHAAEAPPLPALPALLTEWSTPASAGLQGG